MIVNNLTISYGITAYNEHEEMDRLLSIIEKFKKEHDEIVILIDDTNPVPTELMIVIDEYSKEPNNNLSVHYHKLNKHFGDHKNYLNSKCQNDWIVNLDADEFPHEFLIKNIHEILESNPEVELFRVPRVNIVENITQDHINRWRWKVNEKGWLQWPDFQSRIFRNTPEIHWTNPVHEVIVGHKTVVALPAEEQFCLYHPKKISKQEQQNQFYSTIA